MLRMEMACFFVIMLMSILYFSAKRKKTKLHMIFSAILVLSMVHLIFDSATIYTVNRLDEIPAWINDVFHRLFIGTMVVLFYLFYRYVVVLIEEESGKKQGLAWLFAGILVVAVIGAVALPLYYRETEIGNYSYGPAAYMTYASIGVHLIGVVVLLAVNWKKVHAKKKIGITVAMAVEIIVALYQAVHPMALLSGMGIMLIVLSFYLTMQNPDIALVEQVQEEKRKADAASEAKSTFLSHMSHEIRTPMNAVVGMTELMLRTDITLEQREYLINIKNSGNALVSIINDILDLTKIESGKMELTEENYEVAPMLKDIRLIIENRIGDKPIALIYEVDEKLPARLRGDALRIRQVMINLLNNAVKFTEEGHVKLSIAVLSASENEVEIKISVSDTGQGIRKEDLKRLFEAFEQVDTERNRGKEGTGLGLAISSDLIRLMGGKLEVQSVYDEGSEFYFTIKQKTVSGNTVNTEEEDERDFTAPAAKILVVDDSQINLKIAMGLLKPLRMQVDTAESGRQALEMVQSTEYNIIFMDHMMPGMDGIETTRRMRQLPAKYLESVPIVAFTANAMKEAEKSFYAAGMNGFIPKPIETEALFKAVRRYLPDEYIVYNDSVSLPFVAPLQENLCEFQLDGIDVQAGVKSAGSTDFYMEILGDFYLLIDTKSLKIEKCTEDGLWRDYTVEVHALKTSARMIGAMELSQEFAYLEQLGKEENAEEIMEETPKVLAHYRSYKEVLKPFRQRSEGEKRETDEEEVLMYLKGIRDAVEGFDLDGADEAMAKLEECRLPENVQEKMEKLRVFIADVAMEDILRVVNEMTELIVVEKGGK